MAHGWDIQCPECGEAEPVFDWSHGEVVCTGCGIVLESSIIDDRPPREHVSGGLTYFQATGRMPAEIEALDPAFQASGAHLGVRVPPSSHKPALALTMEVLVNMAAGACVTENVTQVALQILRSLPGNKRFTDLQRRMMCVACIFNAFVHCNVPRRPKEVHQMFDVHAGEEMMYFNRYREETLDAWAQANQTIVSDSCSPDACIDRVLGAVGKENLAPCIRGKACDVLDSVRGKMRPVDPLVLAAAAVTVAHLQRTYQGAPTARERRKASKTISDTTGLKYEGLLGVVSDLLTHLR